MNLCKLRASYLICNLTRFRGIFTGERIKNNASFNRIAVHREKFNETLPCLVENVVNSFKHEELSENRRFIRKVLEYNLDGGKQLRGLSTILACELLEKPENITEKSLHLNRVMGFCVEMFQAFLIIQDDIMDGSTKRRGKPCLHTLPGVGLGAINDSLLMYSTLNHTIRSNFGHLPQYHGIIDIFNEFLLLTSFGQHLDYTTAKRRDTDYRNYNLNFYKTIVKYKSSYTFNLPVRLGMLLANINNENLRQKAKEICDKLCMLFQMQDDFIDLFKSESVSGKLGTDVQEGKCTWLATTALRRCSSSQRRVFTACYGSAEPAHQDRIRRLYEELRLPEVYREEERARREEVVKLAEEFGEKRSTELFLTFLDVIYDRNK